MAGAKAYRIPMRSWLLLFLLPGLTAPMAALGVDKPDLLVVRKAQSRLYLQRGGEVLREYRIALGANPVGHKRQLGDERTPEGRYTIDYKLPNSRFHRALHISYPNERDLRRAKARGVDPGGQIMIHGQKNGWGWLGPVIQWLNWTDGCIVVTDSEMDEIWGLVEVGILIEILL
jgi:murein L,D-transpeptidase YafK